MVANGDLVLLGKVAGTHGIRGELRVVAYSGDCSTLAALDRIMLRDPRGSLQEVAIASVRPQGGKALVRLEAFTGIDEVAPLVGREVLARRGQLPDLEEGEYYWHDLLGLRVVTEGGGELGTIAEIIATGSNDVYVVRGQGREYMIPATTEVVTAIDIAARTMTVSPLEGLLDL
jgi:16S rRNA processing protein RimM